MSPSISNVISLPVLGAVFFLSLASFKNDFLNAKQIEIFTEMYKQLNMNYVDETNPAELMDNAIGMLP
jgi:carboxyl-terminal processing protease